VGQIVNSAAIGASANISVNVPIGVTINQGNFIVKLTDTYIYVGNTTVGNITDSRGTRIQRGL
jgi:hypothetical protein